MTSASHAAESAPKANPSDQTTDLTETFRGKKLPEPTSFGDTEEDLIDAMVAGLTPIDVSFCDRIKLIEITDGLLPLLDQPLPRYGDFNQTRTSMIACKLFALRGQILCQQEKIAEGQAWLLKPRLMARRPGGDQSLLQLLTAIAMDAIGQQSAARYTEIWAEPDRLAYVKSAELLLPLGALHTAILLDGDPLPGKVRMRTMIVDFKSLTPAQQRDRLEKLWAPAFPGSEYRKEWDEFLNLHLDIITNLTPETYDAVVKGISSELDPLTPEKIGAFTLRSDEVEKQVRAEATRPAVISPQKAATLYRALMTTGFAGIARERLDLDLKAKLVIVAMQKGSSFDEACLANLTTADGKALRLGTREGYKAILTADGQPFLTIGGVKRLSIDSIAEARAAEPSAAEKLYAQAPHYFDTLDEKKLEGKQQTDRIETEKDLLLEMANGNLPVDQAFFGRIDLAAVADSLLPLLELPTPTVSGGNMGRIAGAHMTSAMVFVARGHQLCQQGKNAEGRSWLLRAHQLARKSGGDRCLLHVMVSCSIESLAQSAAACYVEIWPEAERLEYIERLGSLQPLPDAETAAFNNWKLIYPSLSAFEHLLVELRDHADAGIAAKRLKSDRRMTALKLALRHGASLQADQVALLTDHKGRPLKLGTSLDHQRKAIVGQPIGPGKQEWDDNEYQRYDHLVIGPIK
jgi:hypothetical protein